MFTETRIRLTLGTFALALFSGLRVEAGILDQHVDSPESGTTPAAGVTERAQTFTVGMSGILERVELNLKAKGDRTADFVIELRKTADGLPSNDSDDILKSESFTPDDIPEAGWLFWNNIQLAVQRGQHLAIVVRSREGKALERPYGWTLAEGDVYRGGKSFCRQNVEGGVCGTNWTEATDQDNWFRTFVLKRGGPRGDGESGGEGSDDDGDPR